MNTISVKNLAQNEYVKLKVQYVHSIKIIIPQNNKQQHQGLILN